MEQRPPMGTRYTTGLFIKPSSGRRSIWSHFFKYDLDSLYSIRWDSEENGGIDRDKTTLSAWQLKMQGGEAEYAFGISEYLPYGTYVLAEQQPFKAQWMDFENRHYRIDPPKGDRSPIGV